MTNILLHSNYVFLSINRLFVNLYRTSLENHAMKPIGSKFEYENDRNNNLMDVYHTLISSRTTIRLRELMVEVVNSPARRFWVSEERAAIVISAMMRGNKLSKMNRMKREMFTEIYNRVVGMRKENPSLSISEATFIIIRQEAPKFYLTPGSAKVIIHRIKKKWYEEKKRKLRHLF